MRFLECARVRASRKWLAASFLAFMVSYAPLLAGAPQIGETPPSGRAQLSTELEPLGYFTGRWSCQGVFPSNGKQIASEIAFAPDLEGVWLTVRHDDLPPNRFHAFEMWGFDKEAKQLVAFIYDNFGGARKFTSSGWSENMLVWASETSNKTPSVLQRFVFRRVDPGQFVVNYEVKRSTADWAIGDTLTCKK